MSLFSNSSKRTNGEQKDKDLQPLTLRMGANFSLSKTAEILPEYEFDIISPKEDYHEIYARKDYFEFTISFIEDFGKTHVSVLCYSDTKPFQIKKQLKSFMIFLKEKLSDYIV